MSENWQDHGFGLYIHWPFCQAKCPYCDFNSHVVQSIDQGRWAAAYVSELDRIGSETEGRTLKSVFFGGGTPSLMDAEVVDVVLRKVRATWPIRNDVEITLEANPTSVEAGRFEGYQDAGVNRVSLGVQALNDLDLKRLGRLHTVNEALEAFDIARAVFDRVSIDLMYGRQDQTAEDWKSELQRALALGVDHLSLYQLTIEQGTAFGARYEAGTLKGLPDEDLGADLYEITQTHCEGAGLNAYETSNHAKPGCESQHNLIYWRGGDYAGIGPGAHGRLTFGSKRFATETLLSPQSWLEQVEQTGSGESMRTEISMPDRLTELVLMGLRLTEGIETSRFPSLGGDAVLEAAARLEEEGFVCLNDGRLSATKAGRPVLNGILRQLLDDY